VLLCLGAIGWDAALRVRAQVCDEPLPRPRPRFTHGAVSLGERLTLLGCFHVSQQNTFTGRLTPEMLDEVLAHAATLAADAG
jgi:uracil-DNA glycosylase